MSTEKDTKQLSVILKSRMSLLKDKILPPIEEKTFLFDEGKMSTVDFLSFYIMETENTPDDLANSASVMDKTSDLTKEN